MSGTLSPCFRSRLGRSASAQTRTSLFYFAFRRPVTVAIGNLAGIPTCWTRCRPTLGQRIAFGRLLSVGNGPAKTRCSFLRIDCHCDALILKVATTLQRMLDASVPLFWQRVIERDFASSIVSRLVENPIETPRFATSPGCPTAIAPAATHR